MICIVSMTLPTRTYAGNPAFTVDGTPMATRPQPTS